MILTRKLSRCASATASMMARAWFDGEGRAPSRIRPALGQPNSPMTISLFGIAAATWLRMAAKWAAAREAGIGKSSQYGNT